MFVLEDAWIRAMFGNICSVLSSNFDDSSALRGNSHLLGDTHSTVKSIVIILGMNSATLVFSPKG